MADNGASPIIDFGNYIGGEESLQIAARAIRALKKDFEALGKTVGEDASRVQKGLQAIDSAIAAVQAKGGSLLKLDPEEKKILADLIKEIGNLKAAKAELKATEAAQKQLQQGLTDATKQYTSELAKQKDALRAAAQAGDAEGQRKAAAAIRETTLANTQLSKALRGANSELTAAKGSYDELVARNNRLTASLRAMGGGLDSTSDEAVRLQLEIEKNNTKLREFDQGLSLGYRNVGRYAESFESVVKELARARVAQQDYAAGSERAAAGQLRIAGFQTAAQKAAAQAGLSYEQATAAIEQQVTAITPLTQALNRLEKEQIEVAQAAGAESEAYRKIGFQIQSTKKEIDDIAASTAKAGNAQGGLGKQLGFTKEGLKDYAAQLAVGAIGLQALAGGAQAVFQANVEYSRNLAEIRKSTGLTADEADRLGVSLKALNTPTSIDGLLKIASVGGQLGIAKTDLLEFTKAIDTAVQALGNDGFAGGAEEIATVLGRIGQVYRKELGPDTARNILAVGSAVNELGAVGSATSPFLVDVAQRVGAISATTGIGLKNVLAYAAVLQETGSSSEVAGTALNRFFSTLSTKTKESFEIARKASPSLTLKEFTRLVNTDFNAAAQLFLKGLNAGGQSTTALSKELATLKLQSGEAKNAIITLAQNTDLFTERQKTANDQLRDATSLSKEAAVNVETLGGSVDQLKNETGELVTSGFLAVILKFLVDMTRVNFKLIREGFGTIADGFAYVAEKAGLIEKPQKEYAAALVATTKETLKQATSLQQLADSYTALLETKNRTTSQELELQQTAAKVRAAFGTLELDAIQQNINKRRQQAEVNKQSIQTELGQLDGAFTKAEASSARYQAALNEQSSKLTTSQLEQAKKVAEARLDANRPLTGKSSNPELEPAIAAATSLIKANRLLTEVQTKRAPLLAALKALQEQDTSAKIADVDATDDQVEAERDLGRYARENAKDNVQILKDRLADNQRLIDAARKYQQEQGKLFEERQISEEKFAESVAGSEDVIIQAQRNGLAIRKQLIRAEATEQLAEAEKRRTQQLKNDKLSQEERLDIQREYNRRAVEIVRVRKRDILLAEADLQKALEEKPLEFKLAGLDAKSLKVIEDGIYGPLKIAGKTYEETLEAAEGAARGEMAAITRQYAQGKVSRQKYEEELSAIRGRAIDKALKARDDFHKAENEIDVKAAEKELQDARDLAERRKAIAEQAGNTLITIDSYYTQFRQNELDGRIQNVQAAYDAELLAAGENEALKAQITKKYDKELKKLNYEKAKADRDAALFQIAISTAVGIAKAFADAGFPAGLIGAGIVLANGLLQGALVASKPLPQYFKGRKSGPAEWAEVAERGPELIKQKSTGRFIYQAARAIVPLGKDDVVHTAAETTQLLAEAGLSRQQAQQPSRLAAAFGSAAQGAAAARESAGRGVSGELLAGIRANTAALGKLKQVSVNVHRGSDADVETSRNLTHYLSQRRFR